MEVLLFSPPDTKY